MIIKIVQVEVELGRLDAKQQDKISFLTYRIGESVDLPVHGKPYLSPHHSELLECLPTQYKGEEFPLSPQCMDDFRFSDVTWQRCIAT